MLKRLAKKVLQYSGLEIRRLPRHVMARDDETIVVDVASYPIRMYARSLLPDLYGQNSEYAGELGRLVGLTHAKYPDLRVIDIGANYGDTVAVIKHAADVPVMCIEGDERAFALLKENIVQFTSVTAVQALLGERVERLAMRREKEGWNLTLVPDASSSTEVAITTLDACMAAVPSPESYRVLKIDTEGFDCRILRGGREFLRRVRPAITMEYNRDNMRQIGEDGLGTLKMLGDMGYDRALFFDENGRLLLPTRLQDHAMVQDLHEYASGRAGAIYYYDLCLFHETDEDVAAAFIESERARR
jgi:FkbM family methyltransferase